MKIKRLAALAMGGVMASSILAGCGIDKDAEAATLDGEKISLGIANFSARILQAGYDDFYAAYFGEDVWSSDLYGDGSTMQETVKEDIMEQLQEQYILKAHMEEYGVALSDEDQAAITEAASAFLEANSKEALSALGADQEIVEEYLTLQTISSRMEEAIKATADMEVSDEEANTSSYSYVAIPKSGTDEDGNSVDYTDEELEMLAGTVGNFALEAKADGMETAAEKYEYTVGTGTFTAEDEDLDEAVLTALQGLGEGEISDVIDLDDSYEVVRLDLETDEEATEENRESIIEERKDDLYDEVLDGWKESHTWTVNEKNWAKVTFDNLFTTIVEETETEEVSEETEAEADADGTAAEETEAEAGADGTAAEETEAEETEEEAGADGTAAEETEAEAGADGTVTEETEAEESTDVTVSE